MASAVAPAPLRQEGTQFWADLTEECKKQISVLNCALTEHGIRAADHVECHTGQQLRLIRSRYPSTSIHVSMIFEQWGPVLRVCIAGHEGNQPGILQQEFEMPLATDVDGCIVGVFDEGRSLCPRELASYLVQHFRHCFPRISLPCPDAA
ncbi:MAG: hypothetical protein WB676_21820 [Bryobacteraceae bacterium]